MYISNQFHDFFFKTFLTKFRKKSETKYSKEIGKKERGKSLKLKKMSRVSAAFS